MNLLSVFLISQAGILAYEAYERQAKYQEAWQYSQRLGKPMLVVGGPYASPIRQTLHIPAHGCGDLCLDIDPTACQGCLSFVAGDVRDIPYPDGFFGAAFVSHVLEHLPTAQDAHQAWQELHRVADKVFVAYPSKASLLAWLIPDHHLWVAVKDDVLYVQERAKGYQTQGIEVK